MHFCSMQKIICNLDKKKLHTADNFLHQAKIHPPYFAWQIKRALVIRNDLLNSRDEWIPLCSDIQILGYHGYLDSWLPWIFLFFYMYMDTWILWISFFYIIQIMDSLYTGTQVSVYFWILEK